ncbi:MAG: cell division protein FtsB [Acidobacteriota bacterium]|nr:cell division protein FtsB [Acidobacteriota bacterium]
MAANPFWTDARLDTQRPVARALSLPSPAAETGIAAVVGTRAGVRRRDFAVPSWVVFSMIMLATFAVCVTVTMRTHAEMRGAEQKFERMSTEVQSIREKNASLRRDVERLRTDPRAIEAAARDRLNMVRANEVVIPLD